MHHARHDLPASVSRDDTPPYPPTHHTHPCHHHARPSLNRTAAPPATPLRLRDGRDPALLHRQICRGRQQESPVRPAGPPGCCRATFGHQTRHNFKQDLNRQKPSPASKTLSHRCPIRSSMHSNRTVIQYSTLWDALLLPCFRGDPGSICVSPHMLSVVRVGPAEPLPRSALCPPGLQVSLLRPIERGPLS